MCTVHILPHLRTLAYIDTLEAGKIETAYNTNTAMHFLLHSVQPLCNME